MLQEQVPTWPDIRLIDVAEASQKLCDVSIFDDFLLRKPAKAIRAGQNAPGGFFGGDGHLLDGLLRDLLEDFSGHRLPH